MLGHTWDPTTDKISFKFVVKLGKKTRDKHGILVTSENLGILQEKQFTPRNTLSIVNMF